MMNLRKAALPQGWYPREAEKIAEFLGKYAPKAPSAAFKGSIAAAAPHAGWYYSGAVAAQASAALAAGGGADAVVVIGGHLPEGIPPLFAMEEAVETPLGTLEIDTILRDELYNTLQGAPDRYQDNTVEVLLPMVKYFFPGAKLIWLRLPAELSSFTVGKFIARTALSCNKKLLVLGSTDLTHYGINYRFAPKGAGPKALEWVKTVNDKRFIEAVEQGKPDLVLERAEKEWSACSAGAVLGVMGFAAEMGATEGKLLAYSTSADIALADGAGIPDSFVGYGAFVWRA
jgi:AmmeMemoRadiSam system protein B